MKEFSSTTKSNMAVYDDFTEQMMRNVNENEFSLTDLPMILSLLKVNKRATIIFETEFQALFWSEQSRRLSTEENKASAYI